MIPFRHGLHYVLLPLIISQLELLPYLELGVSRGESMRAIREGFALRGMSTNNQLYGVDVDQPDIDAGDRFWHMTTQEFIAYHAASVAPFKAVFIDANHAESSVWDDFFGIFPYVAEQGLVLLHDTYPHDEAQAGHDMSGTAWRAVVRMSHTLPDNAEMVTLPFSPGLTIVRKRSQHLPWVSL